MARPPSVRFLPWTPDKRQLFRLVGDDWRPPSHVRSTRNAAGDRLTLFGRFEQADGTPVRLTVRLQRGRDGVWDIVEQKLDLKLTFGREAAR